MQLKSCVGGIRSSHPWNTVSHPYATQMLFRLKTEEYAMRWGGLNSYGLKILLAEAGKQ